MYTPRLKASRIPHAKKYSRFLHSLSLFLTLFACWLIFSGKLESFFIISGLFSCALTVYIAHRMDVADHEGHPMHIISRRPFLYWLWLGGQVFISAWEVTRTVWCPRLKITPTLAWIPDGQDSDLGRATYANSITLTPGTVCINVENGRMEIHALQADSVEHLLEGDMQKRVRRMIRDLEIKAL